MTPIKYFRRSPYHLHISFSETPYKNTEIQNFEPAHPHPPLKNHQPCTYRISEQPLFQTLHGLILIQTVYCNEFCIGKQL